MPLTIEQRVRNQEAKLVRDRAHAARLRQLRTREAENVAAMNAKYEPEYALAHDAVEAVLDERKAAEEDTNLQIRALEAKLKDSLVASNHRYEAACDVQTEIWTRRNLEMKAADAQLAGEFPDLRGHARWSAASWKDYKEFLDK